MDSNANPEDYIPSPSVTFESDLQTTISTLPEFPGLDAMSGDANNINKRERSNAKAVECLDMDGNLIEVFRSGSLASQALNIQQGDISLCCRGLKHSIMGYRFRFFGETEDRHALAKIKKGFVYEGYIEGSQKAEPTRSTRASRGDYSQAVQPSAPEKKSVLAPPEIKARTWSKERVSVGPFMIYKWLPTTQELPTPELQTHLPKSTDKDKKSKVTKRKSHSGRASTGDGRDNTNYRESRESRASGGMTTGRVRNNPNYEEF